MGQFTSGGQSIRVSASASGLPMNIQDWFPLELTCLISLQSKELSRVFSNTAVWKHQFFWCSACFMVQLSHSYLTTGKNIALTIWTFAGSQHEELHPWQRSWGRRLGIRKGGLSLRSPLGNSQASTPKTRVCLLYCFVLSSTPLTLWRAVPHHHLSLCKRVNLLLQLIKFLGVTRVF